MSYSREEVQERLRALWPKSMQPDVPGPTVTKLTEIIMAMVEEELFALKTELVQRIDEASQVRKVKS